MALLKGQTAVVTGASMGIGESIAEALAKEGVNLVLVSRSQEKLSAVESKIKERYPEVQTMICALDIQDHSAVDRVVGSAVTRFGQIDILINNAGLALGAPARFWELPVELINQMNGTNVAGVMFITHSVLNRSMWPRKAGTIINISSVTGLECPPFDGEAVYHANKACLEAFSNSLRMETAGSNIRVLVLRPGCVDTHFHLQRVKYDQSAMDEFFYGYDPLVASDLSDAVLYMLSRPERTSIKALDCVPTAQRCLTRFDREWKQRNQQ